MRLLLDTHAFLWWLAADRRLSPKVRRAVENKTNTILVSAASAWEITTKVRRGRLPSGVDLAADVAGCVSSQGFVELEITMRHAQVAGNLPGEHRDPFDRILIAQAQLEDLAVATDDRVFEQFAVRRFW